MRKSTRTAKEVADFFAALNPDMEVTCRHQCEEDATSDQFHVFILAYRVGDLNYWHRYLSKAEGKRITIDAFYRKEESTND